MIFFNFFCTRHHTMEDLITHVDNLSKQCAAITISRRANDRHTALRRRLARVNLPLISVLCKLKRKLVVQSVTSEEFESYVRSVLYRFRSDIQSLVQRSAVRRAAGFASNSDGVAGLYVTKIHRIHFFVNSSWRLCLLKISYYSV